MSNGKALSRRVSSLVAIGFGGKRFYVISAFNKTALYGCGVFAVFRRGIYVTNNSFLQRGCGESRRSAAVDSGNVFQGNRVRNFGYVVLNGCNGALNVFKLIVYGIFKSEFNLVFADSRSTDVFGNVVKIAIGNGSGNSRTGVFYVFDFGQINLDLIDGYRKVGRIVQRLYYNLGHVAGKISRSFFFILKGYAFGNLFPLAFFKRTMFRNLYAGYVKGLFCCINEFGGISRNDYAVKFVRVFFHYAAVGRTVVKVGNADTSEAGNGTCQR